MAGSFSFGRFELRAKPRALLVGGERVPLQPKAFEVLQHLLDNRDRFISEGELLETVWRGQQVTSGAVRQAIRLVRRALGDSADAPEFIETSPRRGYRFAVEARSLDAPTATTMAGDEPRRRNELPLAGRRETLAALHAALDRAIAGEAGIVLLSGEAGIGKSRLAETFAREAAKGGAAVRTGRCHDHAAAPPFWPWVRVLRGLLEAEPGPAALIAAASAPLGALLSAPEAHDAPARGTPLHSRFQLFAAVVSFFERFAQAQPVVALLEDLQWADDSSLALLRFVAREARAVRLLIVGTVRPEGAPPSVAELRALPSVRLTPLAGLGASEVAELADGAAPGTPSEVIEWIARRSGGNPFFALELLRAYQATRGVPLAELSLPLAITEAIHRRVASLGPDTASLLESAAVLGERFELAQLGAMSGVAGPTLDAMVLAARDAGLLRERIGGELEFQHALTRDALYRPLVPSARADRHARAADALLALPGRDARLHLTSFAHHAVLGAPAREPRRGYRAAMDAAAMEMDQHGYSEAARHCEAALQAAAHAPDFTEAERAEVLLRMADALRWAGERERAVETLREVEWLASRLEDDRLRARAATALGIVAYVDTIGAHHAQALGWLEDTLARTPADAAELRAKLWARVAHLRYWAGDPEALAAAAWAEEAAARSDEPIGRAHAAAASYVARLGPKHDAGRLARAEALLALAQRARASEVEVAAVLYLATEAVASCEVASMERYLAEAETALERFAHPLAGSFLPAFLAQLRGTHAEACARAKRFLEVAELCANPNHRAMRFTHLLPLLREEGRLHELSADVADARRAHPLVAYWDLHEAFVAADRGQPESARDGYEAGMARVLVLGEHEMQWSIAHYHAAELAHAFADAPRAQRLYERLYPHDGRHVVAGYPNVYMGPVSHALGVCAATRGDHELACRHFTAALRDLERLGASRPRVETLVASARSHFASRERVRRALGEALRERAIELAAERGFARLLRRAHSLG